MNSAFSPIMFVDQTGQLGGAELCLADITSAAGARAQVVLLADGPLVAYLQERGVAVEVLAAGTRLAAITKNSSPLRALSALPLVLRLVFQLVKRARAAGILYLNTPKAAILGALAALLARKPYIYHLHDQLTREHFSRLNLALLKRVADGAAHVIANSQSTLESYRAAGGRHPRCTVIYNGFDPALFAPEAPGELRARLGLPDGVPLAGLAGRFTEWKGQHILLAAARLIPGLHVLLIGDALFTEADRTYADALRATAASPELAGRVHFTGFIRDVPRYLQICDVVTHCSVVPEPFGRVIVEAMLSRRPVIATRAGGALEIIQDGITGRLVTPGDPAELAGTIRELLAAPSETSALAERGYQAAIAKFSNDIILQQVMNVINDVVSP